MSFFGTVLTALVTLLHLYVVQRLSSSSLGGRWPRRRGWIAAGTVLWLMFVFGRQFGGDHQDGALAVAADVFSMHWMGSVFLLAVGCLLADLASGFGLLCRRNVPRIRSFGLSLGLLMVAAAHVQGLRPPAIQRHDVALPGLPAALDGTRIAAIADTHVGEMLIGPRWLRARIDQVLALEPDMIVLVGDVLERGSDPQEMIPVMRRLAAPLGVWAVRGNHESLRSNRRDVLGETLSGAGIPLLANAAVPVTDGLVIAGIDDLTSSRRRPGEGEANLDGALRDRPGGVTILLSHTPWMADYAAAAGADLIISGHTHGGQIWPFGHLVAIRYPLLAGRYTVGHTTLIVSSGTGTWGPRMRLWTPGEITLITLRSR